MAKQSQQKLKLLRLLQIFEKQTDQNHPITIQKLICILESFGINVERKSLYADIELLQLFGHDIIKERAKQNLYYLASRTFELPELKLLVDAVQSTNFITEKKSAGLIQKISGLASVHEAVFLKRQVFVQGRAKTVNEGIYYNVDALQAAINKNRQITCQYSEWVVAPKTRKHFCKNLKHNGKHYHLSPWALIWDNANYYLAAYDDAAEIIKHFRVDKLQEINIEDKKRQGEALFSKLDMAAYTKRTFGMFGGEETMVCLQFKNKLIGVVIDHFGKDILIMPQGDKHFSVHIKIVISPQFFSWVFGFGGDVKIVSPANVVHQFKTTLLDVQNLYKA